MLVTKGARENRSRPGLDPLFRSAAVAHASRVIGGVLWQMDKSVQQRFRCHTGHSYTAASLLAEQTEKIEETLWVSLRMFEERKNLLKTMATQPGSGGSSTAERAREADQHIELIRAMLRSPGMAEEKP